MHNERIGQSVFRIIESFPEIKSTISDIFEFRIHFVGIVFSTLSLSQMQATHYLRHFYLLLIFKPPKNDGALLVSPFNNRPTFFFSRFFTAQKPSFPGESELFEVPKS